MTSSEDGMASWRWAPGETGSQLDTTREMKSGRPDLSAHGLDGPDDSVKDLPVQDPAELSPGDDPRGADEPRTEGIAVAFARQCGRAKLFPTAPRTSLVVAYRYTLLDKLGEGASGVVFAASDAQLGRKIALKVLRTRRDRDAKARLIREAQLLAQLSDPHVVQVYEVGEYRGELYLAMEYVDGQSLHPWLDATRPNLDRILAVFCAAGRGLAAAHARELVHRDFKPENVMVGNDGRVRVMDFGLARPMTDRSTGAGLPVTLSAPFAELTHSGVLCGSPAFMAAELFAGDRADARSDQFAFCVSLWQAAYGERPFAGDTIDDLRDNVTRGAIRTPSRARAGRVPSWFRRALVRGLSPDPARRFASMSELLDVLERGGRRRRIRWAMTALAIAAVLVVAVEASRRRAQAQIEHGCATAGSRLDGVWNDHARAALRAGLLASGAPYAATTADRVLPRLDEHAHAWKLALRETCLDHRSRRRWGVDLLDRSLRCLDDRRLEFAALVGELTRANATTVTRAVQAAAGLHRIDACRDPDLLRRWPAVPADADRRQIDAARWQLSLAAALAATGSYESALDQARRALALAEAIGWSPLTAAARVQLAHQLAAAGQFAAAETAYEASYFEAMDAAADEEALSAAIGLAGLVGQRLARHEEGLRWARHADVLRERLPDPAGLREAELLHERGVLHAGMGAYPEAKAYYGQALALRRRVLGPEHPDAITTLNNLGNAHAFAGELNESLQLLQQALAMRERLLGDDHPDVATSHGNLASTYWELGDYEQARVHQTLALGLRERALGPDHPDVAISLHELALVHKETGDVDQARRYLERVLAIREKTHPGDHTEVASALVTLAAIHDDLGERTEARRLHARALAIRQRVFGPDHPTVGESLTNLATTHKAAGEFDAALDLYGRALALFRKRLGDDHPNVALVEFNLAGVHLDMGDHDGAAPLLARAVPILERAMGADHPNLATVLDTVATLHRGTGNLDEAERLSTRSLAIRERALGPDNPDVAESLVGLAEVALARGRVDEALSFAERALAVREAGSVGDESIAGARFLLARVLDRQHPRSPRARELAEQARRVYLDRNQPGELRQIEQWLARTARR